MKTRPDWQTYFKNIAMQVASRASCLRRQYGAIIVKNAKIVSTGYNGAPRGVKDCLEMGVCKREELNIPSGERYELCRSVHAEANAIINASKEEMEGATIYIAGIDAKTGDECHGNPCMMCARMIKNAGITYAVFLDAESAKIFGTKAVYQKVEAKYLSEEC